MDLPPLANSVARIAAGVFSGTLGLYVLISIAAFFMQRDIIYPIAHPEPPPRRTTMAPGEWLVLKLEAEGGAVEALFFPNEEATPERPAPLVVYFHGNAEIIDHVWARTLPWRERGFHVLVPEYRGYGRCAGDPTEENLSADAAAFIDMVRARPEVDDQRLLLHGISIGGAVAGATARKRRPQAFVLQSTLTSISDIAWEHMLPGFLARDTYRTRDAIVELDVPVLLTHGRGDHVIPFSHGEALAALTDRVEFHPCDGGHYQCPSERELWDMIDDFLANHRLAPER